MKIGKPLTNLGIAGLISISSASLAADPKDAIKPEAAGRFFASICFDIYPMDVGKAQTAAQRAGFRYDQASKLFVHAQKDQQMRINRKRCAFRFLTTSSLPELLPRFGTAATDAAKLEPPHKTNVHVGTEDAGNGLTRAAAKLDR
jgi:hypothetical protein